MDDLIISSARSGFLDRRSVRLTYNFVNVSPKHNGASLSLAQMKRTATIGFLFSLLLSTCVSAIFAQSAEYTYRKGDPNGIGKWYMGREIAHVMGHQAMDWLERPGRAREERVDKLLANLNLKQDDVVIDLGAGSGYHSFKMAEIAKQGTIYSIDIQREMLEAIKQKAGSSGVTNVIPVKGKVDGFEIEGARADKVLMVDVYHEFSHPAEMLESIITALKPDGLVFLIEFRLEDDKVPIKKVHKMSEKQANREFEAAGFELVENISNLPWQHCMVFKKRP